MSASTSPGRAGDQPPPLHIVTRHERRVEKAVDPCPSLRRLERLGWRTVGAVDQRAIRAGLIPTEYPVGERVVLSTDEVQRVIAATVLGVLELDRRVSEKFSLTQEQHTPRVPVRIDNPPTDPAPA
jgi:hypothetical protein